MKSIVKKIIVPLFSAMVISAFISSLIVVYEQPEKEIVLIKSDEWWLGDPEDFGFDKVKLQQAFNWANQRTWI